MNSTAGKISPEYQARLDSRRANLREMLAPLLQKKEPFVWEVGCGHGHFLTGYAAAHPNERCIGIDIARDRVARAERKRARAGLANLHFIHADAADFLKGLPKNAEIASIFVLFPDPWPKRRHEHNRLVQAEFLTEAGTWCRPGTRLYLRTDYEPYHRSALAAVAAHPAWRPMADAPWPFELQTVFQAKAPSFHSLVAESVRAA